MAETITNEKSHLMFRLALYQVITKNVTKNVTRKGT